MSTIQELDSELQGGSRENRFKATITLPTGVTGDSRKLQILCSGATVPGKTRGAISIMRQGQTGRIAGDSVVDETFPFTAQVPKDAKQIYQTFEDMYNLPDTDDDYKTTVKIEQLNLQNEVTFSWNMTGCWVSTLPPVDFNTESADTIKSFEATFTLDDCSPV